MEETTYIGDLFKLIKKYLWLIVLLGIIGGLSGKFMTNDAPPPKYEASSFVLIKPQMNQPNIIINQSDETTRFINSVLTLMNRSAILSVVKEELGFEGTVKDLAGKVRAENENGSYIIRITASDLDPNQATMISNKLADVFKREIGKYLDVKTVEIVQLSEKGEETQILQSRPKANTIMGAIIGLILGLFLSVILSRFLKSSRA
jgi:capsular polysaccharide biosynthesis protein